MMQKMGSDRFLQADTDNDQKLSREEFKKTFTQIQPEAFDRIDSNTDGFIDQDEWKNFLLGHQGMRQEGAKNPEAEACPMIIQPPSSAKE